MTALRPGSVIKDEAVTVLLCTVRQPTFVTINVADFWRRIPAHARYCTVAVDVPAERTWAVPGLLRRFLRLPEFATKSSRLGRIVRITPHRVEFYGQDGRIRSSHWPA